MSCSKSCSAAIASQELIFQYTVANQNAFIERVRCAEPPFYVFELETQPLTKHTILTEHLNKTGRSLLGNGNPNRGFVRLTLSGADLSKYFYLKSKIFHFDDVPLRLDPSVSSKCYSLNREPSEYLSEFLG